MDRIGGGTFGEVYKAVNDDTGINFAVKVLKRPCYLTQRAFEFDVENEAYI